MTRLTIRIGEAEITVELSGCNAEFDGSTLRISAEPITFHNLPANQMPGINPNTYPFWKNPYQTLWGGLQCPATS